MYGFLAMTDARAEGRRVLEQLVANDYQGVVEKFDEVLKKGLPIESLRSSWETLVAQAGPLEAVTQEKSVAHEGMDVGLFALQFQKSGLLARVVFQDGRIAGLHFSPVPADDAGKFGLRGQ